MPSAVLVAMDTWLNTKLEFIAEAWRQKGGWEGWSQVEIAFMLKAAYKDNCTVEREDYVYKNAPKKKADVVLTLHGAGGHESLEVLELKCLGERRELSEFIKSVMEDITKIQEGTFKVGDVRPWAMVLVVNEDSKKKIKKEMEARRRWVNDGTGPPIMIDHVNEYHYTAGDIVVYLLVFLMPVNLEVDNLSALGVAI
ncbi:hypothetical protein C8F04DRAFT_1391713 [Mycena alexandri]|uniref:Uncharacterized protein n=1 Tax=Mycena alexandri TaxID=1745969 RepID=A0AAD6T6Y9_9AGAR|nr:hypothetical protein C8F04DRAFT_1391713 [Mycena alexandri]